MPVYPRYPPAPNSPQPVRASSSTSLNSNLGSNPSAESDPRWWPRWTDIMPEPRVNRWLRVASWSPSKYWQLTTADRERWRRSQLAAWIYLALIIAGVLVDCDAS